MKTIVKKSLWMYAGAFVLFSIYFIFTRDDDIFSAFAHAATVSILAFLASGLGMFAQFESNRSASGDPITSEEITRWTRKGLAVSSSLLGVALSLLSYLRSGIEWNDFMSYLFPVTMFVLFSAFISAVLFVMVVAPFVKTALESFSKTVIAARIGSFFDVKA